MARESSNTERTKIVENAIKFLIIEVEHKKTLEIPVNR